MNLFFIKKKLQNRKKRAEEDAEEKRSTVIGESFKIKGNIEGVDDVQFKGQHQGDVRISGDLDIEKEADVSGSVRAGKIVIKGRVTGTLSAGKTLTLLESARVEGDVDTPLISINQGAFVNGKIDMKGMK